MAETSVTGGMSMDDLIAEIERLGLMLERCSSEVWLLAAERDHLLLAVNDAAARGLGSEWLEKWLQRKFP